MVDLLHDGLDTSEDADLCHWSRRSDEEEEDDDDEDESVAEETSTNTGAEGLER
jgi:hypothetical protein